MRTLLALLVVGCSIAAPCFAEVQSARPDEVRRVPAAADTSADESWREARIRPQDARLAQLIRAGVARSTTFRDIVARLEAGTMIVYLSLDPRMHPSLSGKLTWMTKTSTFRYVRATISTEQSADQMIAALAHELQHALEVGEAPSVVDQRSLAMLYRRIGRPSNPSDVARFETKLAHETGLQVRRELAASTATVAEASRSRASDQS